MNSLFLFSFNNATKYDNLALIISIYNMNEKAISYKFKNIVLTSFEV